MSLVFDFHLAVFEMTTIFGIINLVGNFCLVHLSVIVVILVLYDLSIWTKDHNNLLLFSAGHLFLKKTKSRGIFSQKTQSVKFHFSKIPFPQNKEKKDFF